MSRRRVLFEPYPEPPEWQPGMSTFKHDIAYKRYWEELIHPWTSKEFAEYRGTIPSMVATGLENAGFRNTPAFRKTMERLKEAADVNVSRVYLENKELRGQPYPGRRAWGLWRPSAAHGAPGEEAFGRIHVSIPPRASYASGGRAFIHEAEHITESFQRGTGFWNVRAKIFSEFEQGNNVGRYRFESVAWMRGLLHLEQSRATHQQIMKYVDDAKFSLIDYEKSFKKWGKPIPKWAKEKYGPQAIERRATRALMRMEATNRTTSSILPNVTSSINKAKIAGKTARRIARIR